MQVGGLLGILSALGASLLIFRCHRLRSTIQAPEGMGPNSTMQPATQVCSVSTADGGWVQPPLPPFQHPLPHSPAVHRCPGDPRSLAEGCEPAPGARGQRAGGPTPFSRSAGAAAPLVNPETTIVSRRGAHAHLLAPQLLHAAACGVRCTDHVTWAHSQSVSTCQLAATAQPLVVQSSRHTRWAPDAAPAGRCPSCRNMLKSSAWLHGMSYQERVVKMGWNGGHAWRRVTQEVAKTAGEQPCIAVGKLLLLQLGDDVAGRPPDMQRMQKGYGGAQRHGDGIRGQP